MAREPPRCNPPDRCALCAVRRKPKAHCASRIAHRSSPYRLPMSEYSPEILARATEAARRALRDLDDDEIPARLRRVAGSSARRLPAPLAGSLVEELDRSEWLRDKALDTWPEANPDDPDEVRAASALFLRRPEGWEEKVRMLALSRRVDAEHRTIESQRAEIERLERDLDELRGRLDQLDRQSQTRAEAAAADAAARAERARRRLQEVESETERLRREVVRRDAEIQRLTADLEEADRRIEELRRGLLKERTKRSSTVSGERLSWTPDRPVEFARFLDQMLASMVTAAEEETPEPVRQPTFELPAGLRPDLPEALDWLMALDRPWSLVVDGYNAIHHLDGSPDPMWRTTLEQGLARLRRLAEPPVRVLVFYDSEEESIGGPGPIEARFVIDADEAVRRAAQEIADRVVVVSSDREVREGSEGDRVIVLWSEALAAWLRRRS